MLSTWTSHTSRVSHSVCFSLLETFDMYSACKGYRQHGSCIFGSVSLAVDCTRGVMLGSHQAKIAKHGR